jgi:glycosyltransferase involved in cell wall biosynthesis
MRILVLSQYYEPDPILKPSEVAEALRARGHDVTVICGLPNYPSGKLAPGYRIRPIQRERRGGVRVFRLAEIPYHGRSIVGRLANYGSFLLSAFLFSPFLARPQVIYVWHPPLTNAIAAWWIGLIHRAPFVLDVQDIWPDEGVLAGLIHEGPLVRFFRRLERWVYARAAHILVVTEGARRDLISKGVPDNKVEVCPNWVDPLWFAVPTVDDMVRARELLQTKDRFTVTFAGNLGFAQGLTTVLQAADRLRNHREIGFRLIGTGAAEMELRSLASDLDLENVMFFGRRPPEETLALLRASDALLVHLKKGPASDLILPSKTLTYLAAGRPILMAMGGEAAELIRASGSGVSIPSEDAAALADAVLQMSLLTSGSLGAMGVNGRAYAMEHFSQETILNKLEGRLRATR